MKYHSLSCNQVIVETEYCPQLKKNIGKNLYLFMATIYYIQI
jgi:hypothetical protein